MAVRLSGQLAQLVEHRSYKPGVTGSSPVLPITDAKRNVSHLRARNLTIPLAKSLSSVNNPRKIAIPSTVHVLLVKPGYEQGGKNLGCS